MMDLVCAMVWVGSISMVNLPPLSVFTVRFIFYYYCLFQCCYSLFLSIGVL
jgi:hypothetical protein